MKFLKVLLFLALSLTLSCNQGGEPADGRGPEEITDNTGIGTGNTHSTTGGDRDSDITGASGTAVDEPDVDRQVDVGEDNQLWRLSSYEVDDQRLVRLPAGVIITMNLNFDENAISGFAGCTDFEGRLDQSGDKLVVKNLVTKPTEEACDGNQQQIQEQFLEMLLLAQSYRNEGGSLILELNNGQELVFVV